MLPFTKIFLRFSIINSDISFIIQRHKRKFRVNLHFYIPVTMEITNAFAHACNLLNMRKILNNEIIFNYKDVIYKIYILNLNRHGETEFSNHFSLFPLRIFVLLTKYFCNFTKIFNEGFNYGFDSICIDF